MEKKPPYPTSMKNFLTSGSPRQMEFLLLSDFVSKTDEEKASWGDLLLRFLKAVVTLSGVAFKQALEYKRSKMKLKDVEREDGNNQLREEEDENSAREPSDELALEHLNVEFIESLYYQLKDWEEKKMMCQLSNLISPPSIVEAEPEQDSSSPEQSKEETEVKKNYLNVELATEDMCKTLNDCEEGKLNLNITSGGTWTDCSSQVEESFVKSKNTTVKKSKSQRDKDSTPEDAKRTFEVAKMTMRIKVEPLEPSKINKQVRNVKSKPLETEESKQQEKTKKELLETTTKSIKTERIKIEKPLVTSESDGELKSTKENLSESAGRISELEKLKKEKSLVTSDENKELGKIKNEPMEIKSSPEFEEIKSSPEFEEIKSISEFKTDSLLKCTSASQPGEEKSARQGIISSDSQKQKGHSNTDTPVTTIKNEVLGKLKSDDKNENIECSQHTKSGDSLSQSTATSCLSTNAGKHYPSFTSSEAVSSSQRSTVLSECLGQLSYLPSKTFASPSRPIHNNIVISSPNIVSVPQLSCYEPTPTRTYQETYSPPTKPSYDPKPISQPAISTGDSSGKSVFVREHFRQGHYVSGHFRGNTWVDGYYRKGHTVSAHYRSKK